MTLTWPITPRSKAGSPAARRKCLKRVPNGVRRFSVTLPSEELAKCVKDGVQGEEFDVAPCWKSDYSAPNDSHTRRPDCKTCETYMRFHSPPDPLLAARLRDFAVECSRPSPEN